MTLLAELVGASARVGATAARKSKVRELALLLGALAPEEIDIGKALGDGAQQQRFLSKFPARQCLADGSS